MVQVTVSASNTSQRLRLEKCGNQRANRLDTGVTINPGIVKWVSMTLLESCANCWTFSNDTSGATCRSCRNHRSQRRPRRFLAHSGTVTGRGLSRRLARASSGASGGRMPHMARCHSGMLRRGRRSGSGGTSSRSQTIRPFSRRETRCQPEKNKSGS